MKKMTKVVEPKVEIKPVAWTGDGKTVLKYQGFVIITRPNGEEKVMVGEPMGTIAAARESLNYEIMQRQSDVNAAINAITLML